MHDYSIACMAITTFGKLTLATSRYSGLPSQVTHKFDHEYHVISTQYDYLGTLWARLKVRSP